jgi:hypothetical protein
MNDRMRCAILVFQARCEVINALIPLLCGTLRFLVTTPKLEAFEEARHSLSPKCEIIHVKNYEDCVRHHFFFFLLLYGDSKCKNRPTVI